MEYSRSRSRFAHSVFTIFLLCCVAAMRVRGDCPSWYYGSRPPVSPFSLFAPIFCDPFKNGSILSLPCGVSGPSDVQLNWYFRSTNGNVLLTNSTKHVLVSSTDIGNNTVTVSLNVSFTNLKESVDEGYYVCIGTVKNTNNILSPSVGFGIAKPQYNFSPCDYVMPILNAEDSLLCAEEVAPEEILPLSSMTSHPPLSTPTSSLRSSPLIGPLVTSLIATPYSHSPLPSSDNWPLQMRSSTPLSVKVTTTINSQVKSTTQVFLVPPVIMTTARSSSKVPVKNNQETPPVNTWFYLLSVVVVLTFLLIILVLILVMFCVVRRNGSRHLVHFPSTQEEIGIHRTCRKPSDPLPMIGNNITITADADDTDPYNLSGTRPVTFVQSAPINSSTGHAQSLQYLSFNLGPSFQSNNTLYDEIGPPLADAQPADIRRNSVDYVNRWQFTLESNSTSTIYTLPPDAGDLGGASCNEQQQYHSTHQDQGTGCCNVVVTETDDSLGNVTTDSVWFDRNSSPVAISQHVTTWENNTSDSLNNATMFPLTPVESSQASGSAFLSEELPEDFSDDEDDHSASGGSCVVVCENHTSSPQPNTLDGRTFELNSRNYARDGQLLHCGGIDSIATNDARGTTTMEAIGDRHAFHQTPPIEHSTHTQGGLPPVSVVGDSDCSRSSSSTSGCTDISKYSGDYDRDPAYMRLLLSRVGPHLPGATSPEMLSDEFNGEVRADSGMESLYTEPISLSALSPVSNSSYPPGNNIYKSLNSLTMEPESVYIHASSEQQPHGNCT